MAKKPTNPPAPPDNDDVVTIESASYDSNVDFDMGDDPPPHDEIPDNTDVDYLPDEGDDEGLVYEGGSDGRDDVDRDEGDGDLLSPDQLKSLRSSAEKMLRPLSFMKCHDHGTYTINDVDVTGSKAIAVIDWLIVQRSLWVGGKPVESHGYRLTELNGKAPPRPNTFTNRANWKKYHSKGKETDPWNNIQTILPFKTATGGVISLQANSSATKTAIGEFLAAFIKSGGKRRPIAQFTSDVNEETGQSFPVLRIVGHADTNEDFSFLREMLIKDDPEFPEPEQKKTDEFWSEK